MHPKCVKIAILNLYNGVANEGMRCIYQLLREWATVQQVELVVEEFDVRKSLNVPDTSFDIYLSSGGPGSPLESEGCEWENLYFDWITSLARWNEEISNFSKKHAFFICHSFQLACRYYQLATVCKRQSTAFGVFPVHMLEEGKADPIFTHLQDPFYCVDSRDYQVISPKHDVFTKLGAKIIAIEKSRPHVPYERAIMGIRFNPYFVGTQFHPEADALGMHMYLQRKDRKKTVIDNYGEAKWESMVAQLQDPEKIHWTYRHLLPNFLSAAIAGD